MVQATEFTDAFVTRAHREVVRVGEDDLRADFVKVIRVDAEDRFLDALSGVVTKHDGNWDRSHMARLGGKFAGIVLVDIADQDPGSGYVPLIGAFLFVIGIAYFLIYRGDLVRNVDLIAVGTLYKLAYFSVALWYLIGGVYPHIVFFVVFGLADLVSLQRGDRLG